MRINGSLTNALAASQATAPSSKAHGGQRRAAGDVAQISDAARRVLANGQARLAQLQAAHIAGTYQVSPNQIARSIITAHLKS
jgi:anti-sigma28 factor (negative regulator of flagellin synthesis)